jgi:acetyl-CoA C-acetyltransferase
MTDVVIAGLGMTEVGEHWEITLRDLALEAIEEARADACNLAPTSMFVANMLAPLLSGQAHLGALLADYAGLKGIEASTIEAGSASGGAAVRMGYLAVLSGMAEAVLVIGVEKTTDKVGTPVEAALSTSSDSDYEAAMGLTPNAQGALLMRRYMHEYGVSHEAFAGFPVTAHANGASNPKAMFRSPITVEAYNKAPLVSDPLNMFDIAPSADGAAAVLLTRRELLPPNYPHPLVRIAGSAMASDRLALHDHSDMLAFEAARLSVERACGQANIRVGDVDFFELWDAYSIFAAISLEAAGFAGRGEGWKLAQDGKVGKDSLLPISTFGGLKARGNPGGATGVYQIVEAALQVRGQAGNNQLDHVERALVQSLGGPASSAVTHVLEVVK